jgi:DNA gyrase/topoisomerase IV subunit B
MVTQVLGLVESIRKRPGMYVGSTDSRGVLHLFEFVVHLLFEHAARRLVVRLDGQRMCLETDAIVDADRVLPALSEPKALLTMKDELVMVSALSREFLLDIVSEAGWASFRSELGLRVDPVGTAPRQLGTRIEFEVDPSIFKTASFIPSGVERRLRDLAALRPGLAVQFRYGELALDLVVPRGLSQWLEYTGVSVAGAGETRWGEARISYAYGEAPADEAVRGFVNSVPVDQGSHIRGVRGALVDAGYHPQGHLQAVIQIELEHGHLNFEGPTKQVLALPDLEAGVRAAIASALRK